MNSIHFFKNVKSYRKDIVPTLTLALKVKQAEQIKDFTKNQIFY